MDEVTVDLDIIVRSNLLAFLHKETETRNSTILYATHIFDGLSAWPSHLAHMHDGTLRHFVGPISEGFPELEAMKLKCQTMEVWNSPLLMVMESWLRKDLEDLQKLRREAAEQMKSATPSETIEDLVYGEDKGLADTKWTRLKEDAKTHGDRYYDYWTK